MTVCAPAFLKTPDGYQTVRHWFDDDAIERRADMTGWFIVSIDADGEQWDAIGPFESEDDARRQIDPDRYRP